MKLKVERLANGGVDNTEQTLLAPDVVEIGEKQVRIDFTAEGKGSHVYGIIANFLSPSLLKFDCWSTVKR